MSTAQSCEVIETAASVTNVGSNSQGLQHISPLKRLRADNVDDPLQAKHARLGDVSIENERKIGSYELQHAEIIALYKQLAMSLQSVGIVPTVNPYIDSKCKMLKDGFGVNQSNPMLDYVAMDENDADRHGMREHIDMGQKYFRNMPLGTIAQMLGANIAPTFLNFVLTADGEFTFSPVHHHATENLAGHMFLPSVLDAPCVLAGEMKLCRDVNGGLLEVLYNLESGTYMSSRGVKAFNERWYLATALVTEVLEQSLPCAVRATGDILLPTVSLSPREIEAISHSKYAGNLLKMVSPTVCKATSCGDVSDEEFYSMIPVMAAPLTIVTWNMLWKVDHGNQQRLLEFIRTLATIDADIAALQEVPIEEWPMLKDSLKVLYYHTVEMIMPGEKFMVVLASKHPITCERKIAFTSDGARGVLSAMIDNIFVSVTHLINGRIPEDTQMRLDQIKEIPQGSGGQLLCGDFNCDPEGMEGYCLQLDGWKDAWSEAHSSEHKCGYTQNSLSNPRRQEIRPGEYRQSRCDRVYIKGGLTVQQARVCVDAGVMLQLDKAGKRVSTQVSDHFPVLVTLQRSSSK